MVNQPTEADSSEQASSQDDPLSLPAGDEPLIPRDFVEPLYEAVTDDSVVESSDETSPDEPAATIEPSETTEDATVAETEDTPEATPETTEADTPAPEGETPRTYSTEEWGKRESSYRQRDTEMTQRIADLERRDAERESQTQNMVVDAEARAAVNFLTQQYREEEGMDERTSLTRAQREVDAAKQDFLTQQENTQLKRQVAQVIQREENSNKKSSVNELMREHGVPESDRELLAGYTDATLAVKLAEALGQAEALRKQSIQARRAEVPAGGEANNFDNGSGASGGMTDDQWLDQVYNPGLADTAADDLRAYNILTKQGLKPHF